MGARSILDGAWRMGIASAVMGFGVWFAWQPLAGLTVGHSLMVAAGCLAAVICAGGVIYGVAAYLLGLSEVNLFVNFTRRTSRSLLGRL